MFIKICGIKSKEELKVVEKYANATGVIVKSESKRNISLEKAKELMEIANIPVYAVSTVNNYNEWKDIIEKTGTKYIQIHSKMDANEIAKLKNSYNINITKAFKVPSLSSNPEKDAENLINEIKKYINIVDNILLDTGKGCGITHDLRVSKIIAKKFNIILAGGLNPDNIKEIVKYVQPYGVDLSSGVEKDNRKDESLIKSFIKNLNEA
ncbi:phosphoribosylanthranilate isomerase [Methanothermococcus okinawensis]|uniref:N-(5'-phosphoribosyl)anthranilate isomerase n=1 Tax=Methanothermococcus okinawensis (strain DSM 14208 / JCM 11175 / IH1) TaxID=647113 RepID=F8ANJ5_METOI|nr:phosphoribosylanthranilate isomerase [Methanothermococcus okinawensis]AEH07049.1 Phosphoribosylanthranilate isomerase [Methanothermococcus okinawensis IH1]